MLLDIFGMLRISIQSKCEWVFDVSFECARVECGRTLAHTCGSLHSLTERNRAKWCYATNVDMRNDLCSFSHSLSRGRFSNIINKFCKQLIFIVRCVSVSMAWCNVHRLCPSRQIEAQQSKITRRAGERRRNTREINEKLFKFIVQCSSTAHWFINDYSKFVPLSWSSLIGWRRNGDSRMNSSSLLSLTVTATEKTNVCSQFIYGY